MYCNKGKAVKVKQNLKFLIANLAQELFSRPKRGHLHKLEQEDLCILETDLVYMVNH